MFKKIASISVLAAPLAAFAAGPDMTALSDAVDYGTVTAAVLGVFALVIGLSLAFKGGEKMNTAVKKG